MLTQVVSIGLRPAAAVLAEARRAQRWATRGAVDLATASALEALDVLLASRFLDEAAARVADRLLDDGVAERIVAGLLEREELWILVDEIAQSPAVTEAITQQGFGFADQVAGEVRERSQHADAWLERAARRVLRRREQSSSPPAEPDPA